MKPKLIIMVGNIASGKSTWIRRVLDTNLFNDDKYIVVSKDAIRRMIGAGKYVFNEKLEPAIHTSAIDMVANFMRLDINIIIDETNMDKATREILLILTTKFRPALGYEYHTIAAVVPYLERGSSLDRRMAGKELAWGHCRKVWAEVWDRKNTAYEEPKRSEGFDEIWKIQP